MVLRVEKLARDTTKPSLQKEVAKTIELGKKT